MTRRTLSPHSKAYCECLTYRSNWLRKEELLRIRFPRQRWLSNGIWLVSNRLPLRKKSKTTWLRPWYVLINSLKQLLRASTWSNICHRILVRKRCRLPYTMSWRTWRSRSCSNLNCKLFWKKSTWSEWQRQEVKTMLRCIGHRCYNNREICMLGLANLCTDSIKDPRYMLLFKSLSSKRINWRWDILCLLNWMIRIPRTLSESD